MTLSTPSLVFYFFLTLPLCKNLLWWPFCLWHSEMLDAWPRLTNLSFKFVFDLTNPTVRVLKISVAFNDFYYKFAELKGRIHEKSLKVKKWPAPALGKQTSLTYDLPIHIHFSRGGRRCGVQLVNDRLSLQCFIEFQSTARRLNWRRSHQGRGRTEEGQDQGK